MNRALPWLRPGSAIGRGWATMSPPVRLLAAVSLVLAPVAFACVPVGVAASGEVAVWAANVGWTLGGVVVLCGTLAAGLGLRPRSSVRGAWMLWAAGSACWLAGAVIRDVAAPHALSTAASACWLAFAVLGIASFARRLPRAVIFGIFLLDALPVVLLIVAIVRLVEAPSATITVVHSLLLDFYPALFGLCAANAVQMVGIHADLRRIPASVWLFTVAFGLMALAALFWYPAALASHSAQGHLTDGLWTLGLLALAAAGLARTFFPSGYLVLPPIEKESGPHALPPAAAVLGLITLQAVNPPADRLLMQAFLLAAALALFLRVYLMRRQDVRLLAELVRLQERTQAAARRARRRAERLRVLADVSARLKSLVLAELLQAVCDGAREVLSARQAAFGLASADGRAEAWFITSGMDDHASLVMREEFRRESGLMAEVLQSVTSIRLRDFATHPAAAALPATHPPLDNFLGVPIPIDGSHRAALYLTGKEGGFDDEDETLAQLLAVNAGRAITNAELYGQSRAQEEQLAAQNERLRELDQLKDEFVGLVSHELRTPLTSIVGYLELVQDEEDTGELNPVQRQFTAVIDRNTRRLLRLVDDLLFLAQMGTGKLEVEFGQVDLAELAEHAVQARRPEAERKHISLSVSAQYVPCFAGDPDRIAQLLDNLLSNAVKFTPEGGQVSVTAGAEGSYAALDVTDTGMGIPAAEQAHIFDRFFRTESVAQRQIQGTGLGLTISKAIAEAHDGSISVESSPGHGTTFRVRIPLRVAARGHGGSSAPAR